MGAYREPGPVECIAQPLVIEGFQQVVERVRVESLNCVLIIGGSKDNKRHLLRRN